MSDSGVTIVAGGELGTEGVRGAVGLALGAAGLRLAGLGGVLGIGAGAEEIRGTAGAGGTVTGLGAVVALAVPGAELGALG